MRVLVVAVSGAPDRQPTSAGLRALWASAVTGQTAAAPPLARLDSSGLSRGRPLTAQIPNLPRWRALLTAHKPKPRSAMTKIVSAHLGRFFILSASFGGLEWTKKPKTFTRSCKRDSPDRGRFHHRTRNGLDRSGINGLLDGLNLRILVGFKARAGMGGGNHPQLS
jgi:hypothetical protein